MLVGYNHNIRYKGDAFHVQTEDSGIMEGRTSGPMVPVYFEFDSSSIAGEQVQRIETNADFIKENPALKIRIEGNCDPRGTQEYNLALGQRRSEAVAKALGASPVILLTKIDLDPAWRDLALASGSGVMDLSDASQAWSVAIRPITDHSGRICAFGGRILGEGQPKYMNSPETPVFTKGDYDMTIVAHVEARDLGKFANPKYYWHYGDEKFAAYLGVPLLVRGEVAGQDQVAPSRGRDGAARILLGRGGKGLADGREDFGVGGGIGLDLVVGERRAGGGAAGWIADGGGEVTDEQNRLMA